MFPLFQFQKNTSQYDASLCPCLCLNLDLTWFRGCETIHIIINIKKKKRKVTKRLAWSCFGLACCFWDAVLSLVGVVGREGRKQRERDGQRERDQGMGWEMITADYCVATVQSCCPCLRGGKWWWGVISNAVLKRSLHVSVCVSLSLHLCIRWRWWWWWGGGEVIQGWRKIENSQSTFRRWG